jgi:hypothetical protein
MWPKSHPLPRQKPDPKPKELNDAMNSDSQIRKLESRLLSMLREGEMLRFTYSRDLRGMFSLAIEGDGPEPAAFAQRIGILMQASRDDGYSFHRESSPTTAGPDEAEEEENQKAWLEIYPASRELHQMQRGQLGFSPACDPPQKTCDSAILVPALPSSGAAKLAQHPIDLIAETPAVRRLEMEFSFSDLPDEQVDLVARALEQEIDFMRAIRGANFPASPVTAFLGLWWSCRVGWELRCRVALDPYMEVPKGALEVLGHEIFGVECHLMAPGGNAPVHNGFSLAGKFPDGWSFPSLLPLPNRSGMLAAERMHNRRLPALPDQGILIGRANDCDVRLPDAARDRHLYMAGATGTGKTSLLKRLILDDLQRDEGLVLLDPHGDLFHEILEAVPESRRASLVTIDPSSAQRAISFNLLDFPRDKFLKRRSQFLIGELVRFFREAWGDNPDAFGPMFELYFSNAVRLLIHQEEKLFTLMDFEKVFSDSAFREELLSTCTDPMVCQFWRGVAEKTGGEASLANVTPYIISKMAILTQGGFLSEMIGQANDKLCLEERMNQGGIILVNLNKGLLGATECRFLGVMLTMQIFAAGLKRSALPPSTRRPVNIYIDEFQNFVSDNVASMLSEARKFGLRLNLANQTLSQLNAKRGQQNLLETLLGNVGNMIAFRLGVPDAERLRPFLKPYTPEQMQDLPNFHALVRLLVEEGPIGPLVMKTLPA